MNKKSLVSIILAVASGCFGQDGQKPHKPYRDALTVEGNMIGSGFANTPPAPTVFTYHQFVNEIKAGSLQWYGDNYRVILPNHSQYYVEPKVALAFYHDQTNVVTLYINESQAIFDKTNHVKIPTNYRVFVTNSVSTNVFKIN